LTGSTTAKYLDSEQIETAVCVTKAAVFVTNAAVFVTEADVLRVQGTGCRVQKSSGPAGCDPRGHPALMVAKRERPGRWAEPFLFLTLYYQDTKPGYKNRQNTLRVLWWKWCGMRDKTSVPWEKSLTRQRKAFSKGRLAKGV
jgi:hypothetical protein